MGWLIRITVGVAILGIAVLLWIVFLSAVAGP